MVLWRMDLFRFERGARLYTMGVYRERGDSEAALGGARSGGHHCYPESRLIIRISAEGARRASRGLPKLDCCTDRIVSTWKKSGDGWEKTFTTEKGWQLTVIIGPAEGATEGLAFRERASAESPDAPRPGTKLEDWLDLLSPQALIEIIAKRDKYAPGDSATAS
jgi:hypothetical protein